jgi:hypothetical protein
VGPGGQRPKERGGGAGLLGRLEAWDGAGRGGPEERERAGRAG